MARWREVGGIWEIVEQCALWLGVAGGEQTIRY